MATLDNAPNREQWQPYLDSIQQQVEKWLVEDGAPADAAHHHSVAITEKLPNTPIDIPDGAVLNWMEMDHVGDGTVTVYEHGARIQKTALWIRVDTDAGTHTFGACALPETRTGHLLVVKVYERWHIHDLREAR